MNSGTKRKTANLLTICIKAGKAVKGFDSVCDAVKGGKAFCVLTASDASARTIKETGFVCSERNVPVYMTELSKEDMLELCGKETAVIAVCDKGFAGGFGKIFA